MDKDLPIRSIARALQVLQAVNRLRSPTLMEIARETGLPYPTAFRIIQTLINEGVVEQESFRKRYRATELARSLSSGFQEEDRLLAAAVGAMRDFTATHFWPVNITVRTGSRMMVKHSTNRLTSQTFVNYYPGYTLPLLDCASGRAWLAFCDEDERENVLRGLEAYSSDHQTMSMLMVKEGELLETVRASGYAAVARGQYNNTPGKTSAVALPVMSDGQLLACLTIVFFATAHSTQDAVRLYLRPLQQLAETIAERFRAGCDEQGLVR